MSREWYQPVVVVASNRRSQNSLVLDRSKCIRLRLALTAVFIALLLLFVGDEGMSSNSQLSASNSESNEPLLRILLHTVGRLKESKIFPLSELTLIPAKEAKALEHLALRKDFQNNLSLLRTAGGLDLSKIPHLDGSSEMLGGWAAEERLLDRLQKNAENNLAKDPSASDAEFTISTEKDQNNSKSSDLVLDDSGEQVPEETLRAEAAALGYQDVSSWKRDFFASSLQSNEARDAHSAAAQLSLPIHPEKKRPYSIKRQSKLQRSSIATDFISSMGKLFGSFFKQDMSSHNGGVRVQELFHLQPKIATAVVEKMPADLNSRAHGAVAQQVLDIFSGRKEVGDVLSGSVLPRSREQDSQGSARMIARTQWGATSLPETRDLILPRTQSEAS